MFLRLPRYPRRLDVRLTIHYTCLVLLFTSMVLLFIYLRLERTLVKQADRILLDEMNELIRENGHSSTNFARACENYSLTISHRRYYPVFFRVVTPAGEMFFQNFENTEISLPSLEHHKPMFYTVSLFDTHSRFRVYVCDLTLSDGKQYIIEMGTPLKDVEDVLNNYVANVVILLPIILILSIAFGILLSRKPHAIIKNIVATTNSINAQNLRQRIPITGGGGDETQDLMRAINAMMDRLAKAFEEIKYFTSDVSHELRNPLFSLKGAIEVALTDQRTDEEYQRVLNDCMDQVNALIKMVNDLFLISRFELKHVDLELSDLNLSEVLDDLYDFFLPLAEEKKIQCAMERSDIVQVKADKTKIYQLMSNLIENGIKFTSEGGAVKMRLSADDREVTFTVSDNGPGIPEADLPYIFNRFYQVDKARSGSIRRGSGLGLHICKKIAEAHGGSITAEPNATGGVTFAVKLPVS